MRRTLNTWALQPRPALPFGRRLAAFAILGLVALSHAAAAQAQNSLDPSAAYDALPDESPAA